MTNVPGPPQPLYLARARLLDAVPIAPLVANVPIGVSVLSDAGELEMAVLADGRISDLDVLATGMREALQRVTGGTH
ncbi:MAG: WS/DGAT domain-containing protein [Frankiaceae bacterium]